MHPNRRVIPLYYVLQRGILTGSESPYVLTIPYFTLAGNAGRPSPWRQYEAPSK
jgi:hypothetical protein